MEAITLILIIVFSLISASVKKNKQGAAKTGSAPARPAEKPATTRAAIERALKEAVAQLDDGAMTPAQKQQAKDAEAALAKAREKAKLRAAAKSQAQQGLPGTPVGAAVPSATQGASAVDDEGCLGGSLPHGHEEGESREEHARHIAAMESRDKNEAALEIRGFDARQLRRAVVISEILDRPKALRRRAG